MADTTASIRGPIGRYTFGVYDDGREGNKLSLLAYRLVAKPQVNYHKRGDFTS